MKYKQIIDILTTEGIFKNGKLVPRYRSMIENNGDLYFTINSETNFLKNNASLSERIYCIINNITKAKICSNVTCDNKLEYKTNKSKYNNFCSYKCSNSHVPRLIEIKETCLKKYGFESPKQLKETNEKYKATCLKKYGVEHTSKLKNNRDQAEKTCLKKYGVSTYLLTTKCIIAAKKARYVKYGDESFKRSLISNENIILLNNKKWLIENNKFNNLKKISEMLNVSDVTVGNYFKKSSITPKTFNSSTAENEIKEFINSLTVEFISNTKKIITPYELDIYIPQYSIAIEYCGLYWHSEETGKNKHYHKNKYEMCKMLGIQLITIFEDEWRDRKQQVKNKIKSLLNKDDSKIVFARKTNICKISSANKKKFYNKNHIQGNGHSSINIGLLYDNEIVACMSFTRSNDNYELKRYSTSCRVPGGFSKLLKNFIREYNPHTIISFADLRWSNGNLYFKTGWEVDSILKPDYTYSPDKKHRIHKFNYRRKNLHRLLTHFDPKLSEKINCDNNKILRIWDCGKIKFIYKLEK